MGNFNCCAATITAQYSSSDPHTHWAVARCRWCARSAACPNVNQTSAAGCGIPPSPVTGVIEE
jgi:hypothetical protein